MITQVPAPRPAADTRSRVPDHDVHRLVADWRFRAGYESGLYAGWSSGWDACEDDMSARWRVAHDVVQSAAKAPTFDVLRRRRADRSTARPVPSYDECLASWGVDR